MRLGRKTDVELFFFSFWGVNGMKLSEFKLCSPKCISKAEFYKHDMQKGSMGKCLGKTRLSKDKPVYLRISHSF